MHAARRFHYSAYTALVAILATNVIVGFAGPASAQEFLTLPIDANAGKNRAIAQQCLKDPNYYNTNKAKFDEYFNNYLFPSMTRTEPDKLGEVGKIREDLFKNYFSKTTNTALQADLTDMTFKQMGKIVAALNPPCHPAARYNAILAIGQLDESYGSPEKPYLPANKAMLTVVDSATTGNRFPPSVILGAIVGLERHALLKDTLPPETVNAMRAALLKLVSHDEPIHEMDRDAYSWMRLRAASALARLGTVGDKNAVHDAIVKLAVTNKSLDDRCAALSLLERINYKDVKLDDANTAEPMFSLARDVVSAEDKRAEKFQDQGGGGAGYAAVRPMGLEAFQNGTSTYDPTAFPRRITLSRLVDLRTGLSTVKGSLPEDTQKKVDAVLAAINPVITAAGSKDTVDLKLAEMIHTMNAAVTKAIPGPVKPEEKKDESAVL